MLAVEGNAFAEPVCYWSGTSPVCHGSCETGEFVAATNSYGDGTNKFLSLWNQSFTFCFLWWRSQVKRAWAEWKSFAAKCLRNGSPRFRPTLSSSIMLIMDSKHLKENKNMEPYANVSFILITRHIKSFFVESAARLHIMLMMSSPAASFLDSFLKWNDTNFSSDKKSRRRRWRRRWQIERSMSLEWKCVIKWFDVWPVKRRRLRRRRRREKGTRSIKSTASIYAGDAADRSALPKSMARPFFFLEIQFCWCTFLARFIGR